MTSKNVPTIGDQSFEELKKSNEHGAEYWSARDYTQWRRFEDAIKRSITYCEQSGNGSDHHFAGASIMIEVGLGCARKHISEVFKDNSGASRTEGVKGIMYIHALRTHQTLSNKRCCRTA